MHESVIEHFSVIPDTRQQSKVEHELIDMIILCIFGIICGAEGWKDIAFVGEARLDWFKERGLLKNGIPVDDTIARVISKICPEQFQTCFINWMSSVSKETRGKIIAVDGKRLRHSYDAKKKKSAIHMVSAFAVENGIVLGQIKTADKSNEITAIPELLKLLDIEGSIVKIDAMGCQEKIAKTIVGQQADYVLAVKDNQKKLHEEIKDFYATAKSYNFKNIQYEYTEEHNKGHGRIEARRYWLCQNLDCIGKKERWSGLKSIGLAESERTINGKTTVEQRYFITSLSGNAKDFSEAIRRHWEIENRLHWVLDVTFKEDDSRARRNNAAENLAVMRHVALNAIRNDETVKAGVKSKRYRAALMPDYAEKLLNDLF